VAQSTPHPTTIPKVATGTYAGSASSFPLGRTGGHAQYWFRSDSISAPSAVTAIGPRASRGSAGAGRMQSLQITMANSTLAHSQFTNVFAQNLGAQSTVVYTRKNLVLPPLTSQQDPDQPMVWIVLDNVFPMTGPNLIVDYDLGSAVGAASAPYNGDLITLSGSGKHMTSEVSCGGTLTASSTTTSYNLSLVGATPNQPAWMMLSHEATRWGGQPLPIKLDSAGMPGCVLGVDPLILVGGVANGSGAASLSLPFTLPADAYVIYAQALHMNPALPAGIATTNVTRSILGITGFCSYIYNFTVDGATAQNGPFNWQGVMLLRP
jgi:hypothetical protein